MLQRVTTKSRILWTPAVLVFLKQENFCICDAIAFRGGAQQRFTWADSFNPNAGLRLLEIFRYGSCDFL